MHMETNRLIFKIITDHERKISRIFYVLSLLLPLMLFYPNLALSDKNTSDTQENEEDGSYEKIYEYDLKKEQARNERQEFDGKPYEYDLDEELDRNERQEFDGKHYRYNRQAEIERSERQEFNGKPYKYDRQAEIRRNERQKVH